MLTDSYLNFIMAIIFMMELWELTNQLTYIWHIAKYTMPTEKYSHLVYFPIHMLHVQSVRGTEQHLDGRNMFQMLITTV